MRPTLPELQLMYTVDQLAKRPDFPFGRTRIHALIASGKLRSVKVGGRRLIPGTALVELIEESAQDEPDPQIVQQIKAIRDAAKTSSVTEIVWLIRLGEAVEQHHVPVVVTDEQAGAAHMLDSIHAAARAAEASS